MDAPPLTLAGLNFTHLRSFWATVQEGGITAAARRLGLTQPTVSEQVRDLERALGHALLERRGRELVPTAAGRTVLTYADGIFSLARELGEALATGRDPQPRLSIGIAESLPKRIAWRLIEPALRGQASVRLDCREDDLDRLLSDLAVHRLDLVLADAPLPAGSGSGFNHLLGESGLSWFARPEVVPEGPWPRRLDRAPVLLPAPGSALRRRLDDWFEQQGLHPRIVAEMQDTALIKAAAGAGAGACCAPAILADGLARELGLVRLGDAEGLRWRCYAISSERRLTDPAVLAITRAARTTFEDLT